MRILLSAAIMLAAGAASAQAQTGGGAPFVVAESGAAFGSLQQAVASVGAGRDATILIAPGVYRDCAVQTAGRVTYKARQPGTVVFENSVCEGKAVLVLRGEGAAVDGIAFRNLRVGDGNGAGIRHEAGDLSVSNAMFLNSQEGILGVVDKPVRISIDRSTFSGLGQCDESPSCAHSIYMASPGLISVTRSRFDRGRGGHYVKLRAANVRIVDNSFDDTRGSKTNYMIDLSVGGRGLIADNTFVQGRNKENWSGMIVVAAEGKDYPSDGLTIRNNDASMVAGTGRSPAFVANISNGKFVLAGNRLGTGVRAYEKR